MVNLLIVSQNPIVLVDEGNIKNQIIQSHDDFTIIACIDIGV